MQHLYQYKLAGVCVRVKPGNWLPQVVRTFLRPRSESQRPSAVLLPAPPIPRDPAPRLDIAYGVLVLDRKAAGIAHICE